MLSLIFYMKSNLKPKIGMIFFVSMGIGGFDIFKFFRKVKLTLSRKQGWFQRINVF